jgi:AcrR family transcriptional regulator
MSPRPAPDLDLRREQITRVAYDLAESDGWPAVTMRQLATRLGVTQPVLYSAFSGRQALIDAVALTGFGELATALEAAESQPMARMRAYLDFAAAHPMIYEAMFSLPSGLRFGDSSNQSLARAFSAIREVFPGQDDTRAEVAWSTLHGLVTLQAGGRLPEGRMQARLEHAHRVLSSLT